MITQYDAIAEIEAMKWRLGRTRQTAPGTVAASVPEDVSPAWEGASEAAIRREMERRLARRRRPARN
jgi:hypothetical protein